MQVELPWSSLARTNPYRTLNECCLLHDDDLPAGYGSRTRPELDIVRPYVSFGGRDGRVCYTRLIPNLTELIMTSPRRAACSCGQLHLTIEGEPSRISMCHCLECQRRTGAVISNQARFRREQVTFAGTSTAWTRRAESGNALTFYFCPTCGSTVYWESEGFPEYVAVAIGNFANPNFPAPTIAVWEESRHPWLSLPPDTPAKHAPKQG